MTQKLLLPSFATRNHHKSALVEIGHENVVAFVALVRSIQLADSIGDFACK